MLSRDRIGTFVAVLLGTTLVTTFLVLLTSAQPRVPDRLSGFTAVVRSPDAGNRPDEFAEPVPWPAETVESLVERLRTVPGAGSVVVDRSFYAQPVVDGRPVEGSTSGHSWHPGTELATGNTPGPGEMVVDRELGIPVGASVTLLTGSGPVTWRVSGHTVWPGVYLPEEAAARLAPGVRMIGVSGKPDPEALRTAAGTSGTVLTGDARGLAEPRDDARVRWIGMQVLSATAALAVFACLFLIASTSAYAVDQSRREIGLLRAVGATGRQVRSMLYRSALLLGARAAVAGVAVGALAAFPLAKLLVASGFEPPGYRVHWQLWVLAVAFAAGPLVALAGAITAARRVTRIGPMEALRTAELEPRAMSRARWAVGAVAVGGAVAAGVAAASGDDVRDYGTYALLGAMALIVAAALLAPAVVPALIRVLLGRLTGITSTLARESARTAVRRTASTAAPVLFTVAFAVFVTGTVRTSTAAFDAGRTEAVPAGQVLVPDRTPGLHDGVAGRASLDTTVYVAGSASVASGADGVAPGTAQVSPSAAERFGSAVTVTYADGASERLRVVGAAPDGPFTSDLVLARETVRRHDPSALAPAVYPAPEGAAGVGARKADPADMARRLDAEDDRLVATFTLILLAVSAGAGALAVTNTLLMTARRRRPDLRVLRLSGATGGQVIRAVALESGLAVVIGSLLGGTAGLIAVAGSARSLGAQIGTDVPVLVSWPVIAATVLACLVLAVGAAILPAARLIRSPAAAR
ncbi:ABC transporter permease [Actinoplanes sp. GCM10030250]|uniref:ABC transporter permease n=1 Tax=Actinoplanes sp. GCM10030250 TaxID=3273376 RepID=UPI00360CCCF7